MDLLLEIGCEELPASFVEEAVRALPGLCTNRLQERRLSFGAVKALGTPRRLALIVSGLAEKQTDLDEEVTGPPVRAAFKDGVPTKAAEAFASKLGVAVDALRRVDTPKGEYLVGTRQEAGRQASELLGALLLDLIAAIPFRKSMRWADLDFAFGRPIQWLVALFGDQVVDLRVAGVQAGRTSFGHRFLAPEAITVSQPKAYVEALRKAHVIVDPQERREALATALAGAVKSASGVLIEDEFLMGENASLVEEPHAIVGTFESEFLELPERVILEVAKGHQRYFGIRSPDGKLLPKYVAVVNTALEPGLIQLGNDRVMRARLADAQFFYREDLKIKLAERRDKLAGVVFQKRLGSVLDKVKRVEKLTAALADLVGASAAHKQTSLRGAALAKCDLVALMVGEFPELQGEMGASYALAQGEPAEVAVVIRDHYRPKGASDEPAASLPAALVAIADRLDTLVGCFSIGLFPTGAADPFALRRATLGILRTLYALEFDLSIEQICRLAYAGFEGIKLDLDLEQLVTKASEFVAERLRGLLSEKWPSDVVRACLAVSTDRPLSVRARVMALAELDAETRQKVGEVFKRATNIASQATPGEPAAPGAAAHASEKALFAAYQGFAERADRMSQSTDFAALLREVATIAPAMDQYFLDVFVMDEDLTIREARLRLMRAISERCASVARLELLAGGAG